MLINLLLSLSTVFALELPGQMTANDQTRALEILGLGSSNKFLSKAYPLGGYSGFEVSLTMESLDTGEVANLGAGANSQDQALIPTFTIGKGVYNDTDLYLTFSPRTGDTGISRFGFSLRWSFYEAGFFPLNFSAVVHGSGSNLQNQITTRNVGGDIIMGVTLSDFSLFLGGGYANSSGQFEGGTSGVTISGNRESQSVESAHITFGGTYSFDPFFIGLSADRYTDLVYSLRTGFVF